MQAPLAWACLAPGGDYGSSCREGKEAELDPGHLEQTWLSTRRVLCGWPPSFPSPGAGEVGAEGWAWLTN